MKTEEREMCEVDKKKREVKSMLKKNSTGYKKVGGVGLNGL